MKHIAAMALMLNLSVASVYAHEKPVKMTFSGTAAPSTINLQQPDTNNLEENFAGNGTLGRFTFRNVSAETASPQPSSTCSGASQLYFLRVAGAGVFRFHDGSLLKVTLTQGADCVDLAAQEGHCTMTFQIIGGTGRFKDASGTLALTETVLPVLADASHNPVFFADTGGVYGDDFRSDPRGGTPRRAAIGKAYGRAPNSLCSQVQRVQSENAGGQSMW